MKSLETGTAALRRYSKGFTRVAYTGGKVLRSLHFWLILVLLAGGGVLHYVEQFGITGAVPPGFHILFLVPIVYSGFVFGFRGGLIACVVALFLMLPHALVISPSPLDALLEIAVVILAGVLACLWFRARTQRERAEEQRKLALEMMEKAHQKLRSQVRLAMNQQRRLTTVSAISGLLAEPLEPERTLHTAIDMVMNTMAADAILIFLRGQGEDELILVAYEGVSPQFAQNLGKTGFGQSYNERVVNTGETIVVEGTSDTPAPYREAVMWEKLHSQLIVPTKSRGQVVGTMWIGTHRQQEFSPEDIDLVTAVANEIGTTLENTRLYQEQLRVTQELKASEKKYRELFERAHDAIWVHDMEGNVLEGNKAFEKLSGYTLKEWVGMNVARFLTSESLALAKAVRHKLLEGEPLEQPYEQRILRKDGTMRIAKMATNPVIIDGEVTGFEHIARDVTEEKTAEETLSEIVNGSPIPSFVINKQHKVTHWNTAIESLSGISGREVIGTDGHWRSFYTEKRPTMADLIVDGASADEIETYYWGKYEKSRLIDGAYEAKDFFSALGEHGKWLRFTASPIKNESGEIIGAIETLEDITEEKQLQDNMSFYVQHITRAQEEERKRISRELHDSTAQTLIAMLHQMEHFLQSKAGLHMDDTRFLWRLHEEVRTVLQEVRQFGRDLRPSILDDLGLIPAIEWLCSEMEKQNGIDAKLQVAGSERRFPAEVELMLFRIIQEALRNLARHSSATQARVTVTFDEHTTGVTIEDNGKGFVLPKNLGDLSRLGKLGLTGMQERARLLGGTLEVTSNPGKGTTVSMEVPA